MRVGDRADRRDRRRATRRRATLLQFSTEVCAPCRATARVLGDLADRPRSVEHVDLDVTHRPDLAARYRVLQTPTTLILDSDGAVRARIGGAVRRDLVVAELDHVSNRESSPHDRQHRAPESTRAAPASSPASRPSSCSSSSPSRCSALTIAGVDPARRAGRRLPHRRRSRRSAAPLRIPLQGVRAPAPEAAGRARGPRSADLRAGRRPVRGPSSASCCTCSACPSRSSIAAAAAFVAAFLNSVFDYCLGCQIYLLLARAGVIRRKPAPVA